MDEQKPSYGIDWSLLKDIAIWAAIIGTILLVASLVIPAVNT